jgi:oligosaccharide repeat unit polymerase
MIDLLLLGTLVLFVVLISRRRDILNFFDPVSYFAVTHIVLFFLGAFYRGLYDLVVPISDSTLVLLCGSMLLFATGATVPGALLSRLDQSLFPGRGRAAAPVASQEVTLPPFYSCSSWGMFLLGAAGVAIFIVKCGGILWLRSDFDDYRIVARAGIGWLVLLSIVFVTYSTIGLFSYYLTLKRKLFPALMVAAAGVLLLLQFGNRAPAFEIVVCCGFIFCWHRWRRVPLLLLLLGGTLLLLVLGALQVIRQGISGEFLMVLLQSIWRPFVNIQNFDLIANSFPDRMDFLYGKSFLMDMAVLAPGYQANFGTWLKDQLGLDFTGGSVTVTYLGELFANFGAAGALAGAFLLGVAMDAISRYNRKSYDDFRKYPLIFCICITCKAIVSSGLVSPVLYIMVPFLIYQLTFVQTLRMHLLLFGPKEAGACSTDT